MKKNFFLVFVDTCKAINSVNFKNFLASGKLSFKFKFHLKKQTISEHYVHRQFYLKIVSELDKKISKKYKFVIVFIHLILQSEFKKPINEVIHSKNYI